MTDPASPSAPRVLIVEDEMLISMLLEDMLGELGYEVVGPVAKLDKAESFIAASAFEAAILDVNLGGRDTLPLAELLQRRRIPFLFATGYGDLGLSERFRDVPVLQKPFRRAELARALGTALGSQK